MDTMTSDQFQIIVDMMTMRLNGHGDNIRANRAETVQGFKDMNAKIDIIMEKLQNVQLKVMAVSSFIAAAVSIIGLFLKVKGG